MFVIIDKAREGCLIPVVYAGTNVINVAGKLVVVFIAVAIETVLVIVLIVFAVAIVFALKL